MYCPACKKTFPEGHAFCNTCGTALVKEQPLEAPIPVQAPENQPAVSNQPVLNDAPPSNGHNTAPKPVPAPVHNNAHGNETVSVGAWMGISLLNIIPFIMGFVYTVALIIGAVRDMSNLNAFSIVLLAASLLYIILLLVWAFGQPKKRSLKNYAKATLILALIVAVILTIGYFALREYISSYINDFFDFNMMPGFMDF